MNNDTTGPVAPTVKSVIRMWLVRSLLVLTWCVAAVFFLAMLQRALEEGKPVAITWRAGETGYEKVTVTTPPARLDDSMTMNKTVTLTVASLVLIGASAAVYFAFRPRPDTEKGARR